MGLLDRLLGREQFSARWSVSDPAFAAWWRGDDSDTESVTWTTVLGLSAFRRAVEIIATGIGGLPLRSYERQGDEKVRVPTEFDDPYPGPDGLSPIAWTETVLIHLLVWREAFLFHEPRADGTPGVAYRPVIPDAFSVTRNAAGRRRFTYKDSDQVEHTVGSESITYIPGPSVDGTRGHELLSSARAIFSAAISGDRTAQATLRRGIRIGGLVTPGEGEDDFDASEGNAILENLRGKLVGREHAGDIAVINRKLKLQQWTPNNIEAQWHETRMDVLMQIEQLTGVPPHLLADTEKQTSWGTGVAEQNLGLARFTLMGWSSRIEQVLSQRLPGERGADGEQFCEYNYAGLLQGTPEQEIRLLIEQVKAGILTPDEARKIRNLPPLTTAQKAERALTLLPVTDQPSIAASNGRSHDKELVL